MSQRTGLLPLVCAVGELHSCPLPCQTHTPPPVLAHNTYLTLIRPCPQEYTLNVKFVLQKRNPCMFGHLLPWSAKSVRSAHPLPGGLLGAPPEQHLVESEESRFTACLPGRLHYLCLRFASQVCCTTHLHRSERPPPAPEKGPKLLDWTWLDQACLEGSSHQLWQPERLAWLTSRGRKQHPLP